MQLGWIVFYRATQLCLRGCGSRNSVRLSVRLSVRHTRGLWQNQTMHCGYFDITRRGNHSSFLTPTVWATIPSVWNLRSKWPTSLRKRRLRQIFVCNVSGVRDSEKGSIMKNRKLNTGFPASYRWSGYITLSPPKGSSKSDFGIKFNFNGIKSAVKTSSGKVVV